MRSDLMSRIWLRRAAGGAVMVAVAGCAGAPATPVAATPVGAGAARVWFYRDYEPSVSINLANVALNGASVGYVQADGSPLYRDVAPGHYRITVESAGTDVNQSKDVDLGAGQEAFVKILALSSWESGGEQTTYQRDTFYVSLVSSQVARAELGHSRPGG